MSQEYILYGAGKRCRELLDIIKNSTIKIIAVTDSNPEIWGLEFYGYRVVPPSIIQEYPSAKVCITVLSLNIADEIRRNIQKDYLFNMDNEVRYNQLIFEAYKTNCIISEIIQEYNGYFGEQMNFLFDSSCGLGLGGVEGWTINICESLLKAGMDHTYILSDAGSYDIPPILEKHILYVDIKHTNQYYEKNIINLIEEILKKVPCKIITHSTNEVMLAAYLIKRFYPNLIQIISVIHNSYDEMYKEYLDFRECSDIYVGVSKDIVENMIQMGVSSECLYSMHIPFDCDPLLIRGYTTDPEKPICIGFAGRIEVVQKRMDLLLKVVESLEEKKVNFRLELAGDGTYRQEMEDYIQKKSLDRYVKFLGKLRRSDIMKFWKRQDLCVNIADHEGRSISITEAMGNGAVPIVTATSGVKEDIIEGKNGYIVPLGDFYAMANKIEYLSNHREKLYEMGKKAHDRIYPKSLKEPHTAFWKKLLN